MNDVCPIRSVDLQENGIVRETDGQYIGMIITAKEHDEYKSFKRKLLNLKEVRDAQGNDGNWNYDHYMLGLFNGLELALSMMEGRDVEYRELKK